MLMMFAFERALGAPWSHCSMAMTEGHTRGQMSASKSVPFDPMGGEHWQLLPLNTSQGHRKRAVRHQTRILLFPLWSSFIHLHTVPRQV